MSCGHNGVEVLNAAAEAIARQGQVCLRPLDEHLYEAASPHDNLLACGAHLHQAAVFCEKKLMPRLEVVALLVEENKKEQSRARLSAQGLAMQPGQ